MKGSISFICFICLTYLSFLSACGTASARESVHEPWMKEPNSKLFAYFRDIHPYKEVILWLEGDFNADGIDDLVVVYRKNPDENQKVTVFSYGNGFKLTEPIPAPFEDVTLERRNIDGLDPYELIISGRRGINHGLGVLRFVEKQWIDLFGGLEDCC